MAERSAEKSGENHSETRTSLRYPDYGKAGEEAKPPGFRWIEPSPRTNHRNLGLKFIPRICYNISIRVR